jgi:hypothetical protein
MISAYFDVKPRKAASVPVKQPPSRVFKPVDRSPKAVTPGVVMHAQFTPLPGTPIVGSLCRSDIDDTESTLGEFYDGGGGGEDEDEDDEFGAADDAESLTDATVDDLDIDGTDLIGTDLIGTDLIGMDLISADGTDLLIGTDGADGSSSIDAHFFGPAGRKKRAEKTLDMLKVVFSGPMLCCEDEDFD